MNSNSNAAWARLAHKHLESVEAYQPGKPIEEVERELGLKGAIKMASNENPFGPSPKALKAVRAHLARVNRYPDAGCFYLKRALSKKFRIGPERILVGNGSDELIVMAVRAFLGPRLEAVMATPTFLIYRIASLVQGATAVEVPMKDFRYDLDKMADAVTDKTRIVFIANPDNPVGTYVTHKALASFIGRLGPDCLVFIDEAYYEFAAGRRDYPKSLEFLDRPNVVVSRTFSKAYGLSGLRVGYAFAGADVARAMNKVREPFNVNSLAQAAAIGALEDGAFLRKVVRTTEAEKRRLSKALESSGAAVVPSATNFLLVRFGPPAGKVYESLLRAGVIVRHMKGWGLSEYLRVTVGTPAENGVFIRKLKTVLKEMKWRG